MKLNLILVLKLFML